MSLEIVNKLKPCTFKYNNIDIVKDDEKIHMGFIAQDLQKLFGEDHAIVIENNQNKYLMIQYNELIAPIVKAIQELSNKVNKLEIKSNLNKERYNE